MKQITFGKRYDFKPEPVQAGGREVQVLAAPPAGNEDWLRLGMMIAGGLVTGFIVAAIECL